MKASGRPASGRELPITIDQIDVGINLEQSLLLMLTTDIDKTIYDIL